MMNKDVIKKYKAEFDWWLDGGSIIVRTPTGNWYSPDVAWNGTECFYVINDQYVEFRKALAEGKTVIVVNDDSPHGDIGIRDITSQEDLKCVHERHLRIKHDMEPTFKVGDYVVNTDGGTIGAYWKSDEWTVFVHTHNHMLVGFLPKEAKLWTLEDASDDEWVMCRTTLVSDDNEDITFEAWTLVQVKDVDDVVQTDKAIPYIGQTPAQLGLEIL